ncbi:MAG: DegT/DnrJ/EryC1/StrS family aminotransferase [Syntrophales bacterium]|nr:DegT/DnrJ/EryC1/StrS family aminotransferase [Syntrophales bacterium]
MIPHSRPFFDTADEEAVLKVIRSGHVAQGSEVEQFEKEMAAMIGVKHAVAVSSGTAALHLALLSLHIGGHDEVIIPSYVCTAVLNAVRYVGATPVVADINEQDFNLCPDEVTKKLSPRTKAIIVPHMFGLPAELDRLSHLGINIIEDCAQSLGSVYRGKMTGSLGRLSIFSFYATKVIATGEGGMVLTDEDNLAENLRELRDYDEKKTDKTRFNYKLTDLQAALGRSQLSKLHFFISRRREIAHMYHEVLRKGGFSLPQALEGRQHIYFRYCIQAEKADLFIGEMAAKGIKCRRPVYQTIHRYLGLDNYPIADKVWQKTVSLPIYPGLTDEEVLYICDTLTELYKRGVLW